MNQVRTASQAVPARAKPGYDVGRQQFTVGEPMQAINHSYANASIGSFCAALYAG